MFYITYYAKKHKSLSQKGQYDKPDGTKGKSFVSKKWCTMFSYTGI